MPSDAEDGATTARIRSILSQMEKSNNERFDPPTDLWDRIEVSIAADATAILARRPPSRVVPATTVVEYRIDASDNIIDVGRNWADFARENDAPEIANPAPDRTLWTYFENDEIRDLWQLLVERVRALRTVAEVPFRCDAPHARRWFDMMITPESDGGIHFQCVLAFEEQRSPVPLLDRRSERDDGLRPVPLCGWCGRGQLGSRWLEVEELLQTTRLLEQILMPPISHGICPSCRAEMSAELLVPNTVGETTD